MIDGADVVMSGVGDAASLEACTRLIPRFWPKARFENAETGEKYRRVGEIPFGMVKELLAYTDARSESAWDADEPASPTNSMLYLLRSVDSITVVVDDPDRMPVKQMLAAFRKILWMRNPTFAKTVPP